MNPYRAGLCALDAAWAWWICPDEKRFVFPAHLDGNVPVPVEWLGNADKLAVEIATGE